MPSSAPLLLIGTDVQAQLVTDNAVTPEQALVDFLLGEGVEVSNITFSGDLNQIGSFDASATNIDIPNGIMLATGNIDVAIGPNDVGGAVDWGGGNFGAGDADLTALSTFNTNDAAILDPDFVPTGDFPRIQLHLWLRGIQREHVLRIGQRRVWLLPVRPRHQRSTQRQCRQPPRSFPTLSLLGEFIPVTINPDQPRRGGQCRLGDQLQPSVPAVEPQSPPITSTTKETATPTSVQLDGFTIVMTAATQVQRGQTYHIKIAIAGRWRHGL